MDIIEPGFEIKERTKDTVFIRPKSKDADRIESLEEEIRDLAARLEELEAAFERRV